MEQLNREYVDLDGPTYDVETMQPSPWVPFTELQSPRVPFTELPDSSKPEFNASMLEVTTNGTPSPSRWRRISKALRWCCPRCCRWLRIFEKQLMRHQRYLKRKCPFMSSMAQHFLERRCCIRLVGYAWFCLAIGFTIFMLLWITIMSGGITADPLDNPPLVKAIKKLAERNCSFSEVCRFKDWTYFIGSRLGELLNHQGVVLEIVNSSGLPQEFLQLEYGARGVYWQLTTAPQPDPRYGITSLEKVGSIPCRYKCGSVSPSQRDPQRLLWFLEKYRWQRYDVMYYNCLVFSEMVFRFHLPENERCLTTRQMQQKMAAVTLLAR